MKMGLGYTSVLAKVCLSFWDFSGIQCTNHRSDLNRLKKKKGQILNTSMKPQKEPWTSFAVSLICCTTEIMTWNYLAVYDYYKQWKEIVYLLASAMKCECCAADYSDDNSHEINSPLVCSSVLLTKWNFPSLKFQLFSSLKTVNL